jgi:hypothetical protein
MPRVPMMLALVISAPSQVREVDQLGSGDAREQVLVASAEADDLVWEDRADDQRDVVLDQRAVDPHVDRIAQPAARELGDPLAGDRPDVCERARLPPLVVDDRRVRKALVETAAGVAEVLCQRRFAHRRVGAERNQYRDTARPAVQGAVDRGQQQRQRAAARAVGHQHADAAPVEPRRVQLRVHEAADLLVGEQLARTTESRCGQGRASCDRLSHGCTGLRT